MPRPNRGRTLASEESLARRVTWERERRGWSYQGLASRMTAAGCAINQSGIYKLEKGEPRRRITVDELVAMAQVFGVPVALLLQPPETAIDPEMKRLVKQWQRAEADVDAAVGKADALRDQVRRYWESLVTPSNGVVIGDPLTWADGDSDVAQQLTDALFDGGDDDGQHQATD